MNKFFRTYKSFAYLFAFLVFVCLSVDTKQHTQLKDNVEITLNTKVILSRVSQTCSPATIENTQNQDRKNETAFALKETKYYSVNKVFSSEILEDYTLKKWNNEFTCYKNILQGNDNIQKSLHQIGVLLI